MTAALKFCGWIVGVGVFVGILGIMAIRGGETGQTIAACILSTMFVALFFTQDSNTPYWKAYLGMMAFMVVGVACIAAVIGVAWATFQAARLLGVIS